MSENLKDDPTGVDQQKVEAAAEQLVDLLAQRAVLERRLAENDALARAGGLAMQSDDLISAEIVGVCNIRGRRAFLSAALNKKPEEIDETFMCMSWMQIREMVPTASAYAAGMRALIAQLAIDRPNIVGAAIINLVGPDLLLHLVEMAGERVYNTVPENVGSSAANIHEATGAKH